MRFAAGAAGIKRTDQERRTCLLLVRLSCFGIIGKWKTKYQMDVLKICRK